MRDKYEGLKCGALCFMPDGSPVPELLLESEAIVFLRLDTDGPADPARTLKYYRDKGLLHGTRIGKKVRYAKQELLRVDATRRPFTTQALRLIQAGTTPATTAAQFLTARKKYVAFGFHWVAQCKKKWMSCARGAKHADPVSACV